MMYIKKAPIIEAYTWNGKELENPLLEKILHRKGFLKVEPEENGADLKAIVYTLQGPKTMHNGDYLVLKENGDINIFEKHVFGLMFDPIK